MQRQPESKSCECQRRSAMTDQNKGRLKFRSIRAAPALVTEEYWSETCALAGSPRCPSLSSAAENHHGPTCRSSRGATEYGQGARASRLRRASQCKPGTSACQPGEPSLFPSWHPSIPASSTLVSIYLSRTGAVKCRSLATSTTHISSFVCTTIWHRKYLWKFTTFFILVQLHCCNTSLRNFNMKAFKCQMFTSIIHRRRINSLKTL